MKEHIIIRFFHYIVYIVLINNIIYGLPRFTVSNQTSCIACHINPTGAGMRNDYGNNIVALEELPMKKWLNKGDEDWDGSISKHLQIGGDVRIQGIKYHDISNNTSSMAFFPMQADFYSYLTFNKYAGLFTKLGVLSRDDIDLEYWMLINFLSNKYWLKLGRSYPNYGLKVDDHTSFIRGGNMTSKTKKLNQTKEGLIFDVRKEKPILFEFGITMLNTIEWTSSISTNWLNNVSNIKDELTNFTSKITKSGTIIKNLIYRASINYMIEKNIKLSGLSGGLSFKNTIWTFEYDKVKNWLANANSQATYHELSWKIIQGVHLIGKYDFFDPNIDIKSGVIHRYSLGAELFPLNIMEIKLQTRLNKISTNNIWEKPELLLQTHFYF